MWHRGVRACEESRAASGDGPVEIVSIRHVPIRLFSGSCVWFLIPVSVDWTSIGNGGRRDLLADLG